MPCKSTIQMSVLPWGVWTPSAKMVAYGRVRSMFVLAVLCVVVVFVVLTLGRCFHFVWTQASEIVETVCLEPYKSTMRVH